MAAARLLLDGTGLSSAAAARQLGVSAWTLQQWARRRGWARPVPPISDQIRPYRYKTFKGRPYAADAIGTARKLVLESALTQQAIAARVGVPALRISVWMRRRGWTRPPGVGAACAVRTGPVAQEGDRRGRPYAAASVAAAREMYECESLPLALIGARVGAHPVTVARWARLKGWTRPGSMLDAHGRPPKRRRRAPPRRVAAGAGGAPPGPRVRLL